MSASFVVDVVGVPVHVRVNGDDASLRTTLASVIVDAPAEPVATPFAGPVAGQVAGPVDADPGDVESVLAAAVRAAIDRSPHLLLHAGAVTADGQVTVFPGASGQGKSTLTAACLRRGFGYVTDELVAVDLDTQQVSGLARPLMLTAWSARAMGLAGGDAPPLDTAEADAGNSAPTVQGKRAVAPEQLGSAAVPGPLPVANVVIAHHGQRTSELTPMPARAVLQEILTASFNHYVHGERTWQVAVGLASTVQGWRLDVADPASAAELVAELVASQGTGTGARRS